MTAGLLEEVPASSGQRLLWALDRVRGQSGALNCPVLCTIDGPLDVERLRHALSVLADLHPALRTRVVPGPRIRLAIDRSLQADVTVHDLRRGDPERQASEFVQADLRQRIDATRGPVRVSLLRLAAERHILLLNVHHVVTDLSSSEILVQDLASVLGGGEPAMPPDGWDIAAFSRWEHAQFSDGAFAPRQRYWFERLAGMSPIASPLRPGRADRWGSTGLLERVIPEDVRGRLDAIAAARRTSTFAVLLAVLFSQSHAATGDRDLAVASLFSNRSQPQLRRTVAFLVNLLMLRIRIPARPCFADIVDQCHKAIVGAVTNADIPFQALSPRPPGMTARPNARFDDVVFHAAPRPLVTQHAADDCKIVNQVPEVVGRFDLELAVRPTETEYVVRLSFNERRLEKPEAERLLSAYVACADALSRKPDQPVEVLSA